MAPADQLYRGVTRIFSVVIIGFGVAILVVTLANGGGPLSTGFLIGAPVHRARGRPAVSGSAVGRLSERPPSEQPPQAGDGGAGPDPGRPGRWRLPLVRLGQGPLTRRVLGVPWLFAVAYSAVGFSLYFSIGVVAERGLGLTPLIFLAAGLLFVLATLSYLEGGAMFLERGGSATLARHAFNELVSFIAGWAILIDYIIVIALAAVSVPHYLSPIWDGFTHGWAEIAVAACGDRVHRGCQHRRLHRAGPPTPADRAGAG